MVDLTVAMADVEEASILNAVYLYDEKVLITFNYKDGTKTITFDEIAAKDAPEGNGSDLGCFAPPKKASA